MTDTARTSGSPPHDVRLTATTTIRDGAALKARLMALLDAPEAIVVDVSGVEHVDTSALQLLFAFVRDRRSKGLEVQWRGEGAAWRDAAAILDPNAGTSAATTTG